MSNSFQSRRAQAPVDDLRQDLTDLFVFASAQTPSKTASSFDVNPFLTGADLDREAVARLGTAGRTG
jgi:hypothetical protein